MIVRVDFGRALGCIVLMLNSIIVLNDDCICFTFRFNFSFSFSFDFTFQSFSVSILYSPFLFSSTMKERNI